MLYDLGKNGTTTTNDDQFFRNLLLDRRPLRRLGVLVVDRFERPRDRALSATRRDKHRTRQVVQQEFHCETSIRSRTLTGKESGAAGRVASAAINANQDKGACGRRARRGDEHELHDAHRAYRVPPRADRTHERAAGYAGLCSGFGFRVSGSG